MCTFLSHSLFFSMLSSLCFRFSKQFYFLSKKIMQFLPQMFFSFLICYFHQSIKTSYVFLNLSQTLAGSSSSRKRKSLSFLEKKEIPPSKVASTKSDILLEQFKARIALQEVHHKLDLLTFQMEEAIEFLRSALRCL